MSDMHPIIQALLPYLNTHGMDHPEEVLLAISSYEPPPGQLIAPSHLMPIQAHIVLDRPRSTVGYQMRPGGPLQAECWWGHNVIPAYRVAEELRKIRGVLS